MAHGWTIYEHWQATNHVLCSIIRSESPTTRPRESVPTARVVAMYRCLSSASMFRRFHNSRRIKVIKFFSWRRMETCRSVFDGCDGSVRLLPYRASSVYVLPVAYDYMGCFADERGDRDMLLVPKVKWTGKREFRVVHLSSAEEGSHPSEYSRSSSAGVA